MKKISLLFLSFAVVFSLVGCGSDETTDESITFALWDAGQQPGLEIIAKEFEKETGIKVKIEVTPYGNYFTGLETAAQGGNLPDVFTINAPNFIKFAEGGFLADQSSYDYKIGDFVAPVGDIYNFEGKQLALPRDYDAIGLWYNKEIFEELGLEVPTTWEEVEKVSQSILDNKEGVIPIVIPSSDSQSGYWNVVIQNNGEILKSDGTSGWNTPEAIGAMEWYQGLNTKGYQPDPKTLEGSNTVDMLGNGSIAMVYAGTWTVAQVKELSTLEVFDVAPLPLGPDSSNTSIIHGVGTAVSAQSKNSEAAQKFVEFLATDRANELLSTEVGVLPAKKGFADSLYEANPTLTGLRATVESADDGVAYFRTDVTGWDSEEKSIIDKMLVGEITAEEACKKLEEEANKVLER